MAETPLAFEIITFVVLALFFIVDLFVIGRRPHVPSTKECVQHIAFFVVMALIFGGCIWFFAGSKPAIEFYSGWLTEYSLSIDNLFVFVIIMSNFAVPKQIQKYVLSIGITIALIFRGIFILIGAAQISRFTGHNCPPSIIQKATAECLDVTSDLSVYETNMNLLYDKLTELGFEVERPGGTFYIFPKALEEDANAFCRKAREFDLLLVPSDTFGVKGYVRFAYCIDTEKVKRSLPALEKLAAAYKTSQSR